MLAEHEKIMEELFLQHFGVKGMKWGVRRDRSAGPRAVTSEQGRTFVRGRAKVKTKGGEGHEAHTDAVKVAEKRRVLKKSGAAALSNQELREVATRLQLEAQVKALTTGKGQKIVDDLIKEEGKAQAKSVLTTGRPSIPKGIPKPKRRGAHA